MLQRPLQRIEHMHMSTIYDHNIYARTDHLYDPLRKALDKSSHSTCHIPDEHSLHSVSHHSRVITPAQADQLISHILIPVDKELIPTHHIEKVYGKQFVAVDVEERYGKAMSAEEFSRIRTKGMEEIVYEMSEEHELNALNINAYPYPFREGKNLGAIPDQKKEYKYNLFSMMDDPESSCCGFSTASCCGRNEVIASKK